MNIGTQQTETLDQYSPLYLGTQFQHTCLLALIWWSVKGSVYCMLNRVKRIKCFRDRGVHEGANVDLCSSLFCMSQAGWRYGWHTVVVCAGHKMFFLYKWKRAVNNQGYTFSVWERPFCLNVYMCYYSWIEGKGDSNNNSVPPAQRPRYGLSDQPKQDIATTGYITIKLTVYCIFMAFWGWALTFGWPLDTFNDKISWKIFKFAVDIHKPLPINLYIFVTFQPFLECHHQPKTSNCTEEISFQTNCHDIEHNYSP